MRICAIVVTYNRKELLEKQIREVLYNQKLKIDAYYVIDNCSIDDTVSTVGRYENSIMKYYRTEINSGGAGGFSFGLRCAFKDSYDWYILMDDDGRPFNADCFNNIKEHIIRCGYESSDLYLLNSVVMSDNKWLSFGLDHMETIDEVKPFVNNNEIKDKVNPFNGTWLSNGLVKEIGFPNEDFFIKGDENDYIRRSYAVGAYVASIANSFYFHPRSNGYEKKKVFGKEMYVYVEAPWKEYYSARNYTYSYLQFGKKNDAILFCIKRIYCCLVCKCKKNQVIKMIIKGYYDGKKGILGPTVRP